MVQSSPATAGGRRVLAPVTLAVAVVGLATALVLLVLGLGHDVTRDDRRASALAAARQAVVNFTSFDYRQLDKQFAVVADETTGDFAQQFASQRDTIRKRLTESNGVTRATVLDAGLEAATTTEATAVVALDQVIDSKELKQPVTSRQRVEVHLVRSGDRWLVDNVSPVG
jgi:Mce-associated membrane protein